MMDLVLHDTGFHHQNHSSSFPCVSNNNTISSKRLFFPFTTIIIDVNIVQKRDGKIEGLCFTVYSDN